MTFMEDRMRRSVSFFAAGLVLSVAVPVQTTAQEQEQDDRLTLGLYLDWERVSDPQISPDGQQIVYTRRWVDKINDRNRSSLWIMNADGSRNR
ncbi:MAG: hypothetical protein ACE1ZF_06210, partial [Gemmatimonadales bacterium]